jgi:hypothetical protein
MRVELLHVEDCPGVGQMRDRLTQALARCGVAATIDEVLVRTVEQAQEHGFRGSPAVLLDGSDPFAAPDSPVALACRLYRTPTGLAGCPTTDQLVDAVRAHIVLEPSSDPEGPPSVLNESGDQTERSRS